LPLIAALQTLLTAATESALQRGHESERIRGKDFGKSRRDPAE